MTHEDLEAYLQDLGYTVETLEVSSPPTSYLVIRDFEVCTGSRSAMRYDVAIQKTTAVPYVPPPAVHVRPHVVPMGTASSQASSLGSHWQYLSRILRVPPTPAAMLVHLHSTFNEL